MTLKEVRDILSKLDILNQFKHKSQQQPSQAMQSKMSYPVYQNDNRMQILRNNVLAQTPYTPEARQEIQRMNLKVGPTMPGTFAQASYGTIMYPKSSLNGADNQVAESFRHEALHNLDNSMYDSSLPTMPDSMGFSNYLRQNNPQTYNGITSNMRQSGAYNMNDKKSNDMETFAYYGQDPSAAISYGGEYNKVYAPMEMKPLNYSPRYPTYETVRKQSELDEKILKNSKWVRATAVSGRR